MEDEVDRAKRLAKEKEAKQLHKLGKLAHSLKMDVHELRSLEANAKVCKQELRLGNKQKEIIWRRKGLMKYDMDKLVTFLSFQRLIRREVLMKLDLRTNIICRDGAITLGNCLKDCKTLTHLDVSENSLGNDGVAGIAVIIHEKSTLTHLDLSLNKIGLQGIKSLADAIQINTELKFLGLSNNQLCHSGLRPLADVYFGSIEELDLRGNLMDERAARVLGSGVLNSNVITKIDVRDNPNSREATAILGRALRDRSRRFRENIRKERRLARKEGKVFNPNDYRLSSLNYYWVEPHQLRPQPGNSKIAQSLSKSCVIS